jgi:hypothetical protein
MLKRKHTPKRLLEVVGFKGSILSLSKSSVISSSSALSEQSKSPKRSSMTLIVISHLCTSSAISSRVHLEVDNTVRKNGQSSACKALAESLINDLTMRMGKAGEQLGFS